jgi:hypothetical protein
MAAAAKRCSYTTDARRDRRGLSPDEVPVPAGLVLRTTFPVPEGLLDWVFPSSGFFGRTLRGPVDELEDMDLRGPSKSPADDLKGLLPPEEKGSKLLSPTRKPSLSILVWPLLP